ncbi:hypothetical protein [Mucilaginibacter sp. PAMB04168]|uniref:hypothetical protein n=1 Tax=Mucilaginibacter sp. PAMB04168 TaxID=3138567 RepID=UPI0031F6B97A
MNRRSFVKSATVGTAGLVIATHAADAASLFTAPYSELYTLSRSLLTTWVNALLKLQIKDKRNAADYGGILSPANGKVHGRVADTIYPLLYLANETQESRYVDAASLLYEWMERNVTQPDGSWLNEPVKGSWKGTTVFTIIALCEAISKHSNTLDSVWKARMLDRLKKAGEYVYNTFTIEYGNINYPINAAYALTLLGEILDHRPYTEKGRLFAHQSLACFTKNNHFLYGEGSLKYSAKGCLPIDLGYNVEESLPALTMYALHTKDEEVLDMVIKSLRTHLEFMLPDGGWDNSWGTRNYKWTYWGSRTTDGCLPAYALLASRDARFYKGALQNTKLLQACTHDGLLTGGPHYSSHGVKTSVHHTFCHAKALTTILDHGNSATLYPGNLKLPREEVYDYKFYPEIQTYLVAQGDFRATITGYDCEYKNYKAGHPTGGALTMLWHPLTGPILAGSMNEYQLLEADNMQLDTDPSSMSLTPRLELKTDDKTYTNINDLSARIEVLEDANSIVLKTSSKLVDRDQHEHPTEKISCAITYVFTKDKVRIKYEAFGADHSTPVDVIFPIIASKQETLHLNNNKHLVISKKAATVSVKSSMPFKFLPNNNNRIFNFVPGLEAIPILLKDGVTIDIKVIKTS